MAKVGRKPLAFNAGQRFGRLVVICLDSIGHDSRFLCLCDCGKQIVVAGSSLKSGYTKSCGCLRIETTKENRTTHGKRHTRTYRSWSGMKDRCYNPNNHKYKDYGGRGITVCQRWLESFENFYADMGDCPPGMSIDRINNNGNYEPGNCKWSTQKEQNNNQRTNRILILGEKTQTLSQWAGDTGFSVSVIHARLKRDWSVERSLTEGLNK